MYFQVAAAHPLRVPALWLLAAFAALLPTLGSPAAAGTQRLGEGSLQVVMDIDGVEHTGVFHLVTTGDGDDSLDDALAEIASWFPDASVVEENEGSVSAQAVLKPYQWPDGRANWAYNPFWSTLRSFRAARGIFEAAADTWGASGANFGYEGLGETAANTGGCSGASLDGHNTIGWSAQSGGILAVTCSWYVGASAPHSAVEFDMQFDPEWDWTTSGRIVFDVQSIATHEMGHALGLAHTPVADAVMYKAYASGKDKRALHADDISGVTQIYGTAELPESGGGDGIDAGGEGAVFPEPPQSFGIPSGSSLITWPYADTAVTALALSGSDTVTVSISILGRG